MTRHFVSQTDLSAEEVLRVFELSARMKAGPLVGSELSGRTLVMFFEKASTRTRLSFEIGMTQLGGHAVYLDRDSSQLSRGESIADTARVVSRYADLMMARVNSHATVFELAMDAAIPVINGLSDEEHPCQSMADFFTLWERRGTVAGCKIAYVGDGDNNVTHSLMLAGAMLGARVAVASPPELWPQETYVSLAREKAQISGGSVQVTSDPAEAVTDADVIYTDVWVSMGREDDRQERISKLVPYRVSADLVALAKPDFAFMHCLPAHIGEEVTADVAYGPNSVIFDEAENRLHVQKALMAYLFAQSQGERE
jgi:ornithine carbamoyltransferase